MYKRIIGIILSIIILCQSTIPALAAEQNELNIEDLLNERQTLVTLEKYDELDRIDRLLKEAGAEFLSDQEIYEKMGISGTVAPRVSTPLDNRVTWISSRVTKTFNNARYEVQTLSAFPNPNDSKLKGEKDATVAASYGNQAGIMKALDVIGYSAAGAVPNASLVLTVYDAVNAFISGVTPTTIVENVDITYKCTYTIVANFRYVKPEGASDNQQRLTNVSTKVKCSVGYMFGEFNYPGGIAEPNVVHGSRLLEVIPTGYDDPMTAVREYATGSFTTTGSTTRVKISGPESKVAVNITPLIPTMLHHVY